jgi:hypothetical protein
VDMGWSPVRCGSKPHAALALRRKLGMLIRGICRRPALPLCLCGTDDRHGLGPGTSPPEYVVQEDVCRTE